MKKGGIRAIDKFRKKLMISDFQISKCPEHEVKSKIGIIFVNEKILEEYSVNIFDPYFYEHYKEKIQTDKNDCKYILFRIDIYFTEYSLAVEIDEKGHTDRDLIFEEKRQKALEKKLNCKFIRINTSKENYDADYEASRIQVFISQFKENKIKEKENEVKKLKDEINKLKLQLTNQSVQNNDNHNNHNDNNNNNNSHNIKSKFKLKLKILSTLQKCIFIVKSVKNIQAILFQEN